ncbi:hypothetical protein TRFO_24526 [Tritrichomonas foetus]|uniref:DUF3447 domain-containing protein n=1 Tax=Tritrichomonas foetus TaxID=1144522 RepID=A0A1J4KCG6_9EUKA|nr:hypothetical protein TRFO_24526 [Tritrichomonas foetus]|eukprot:OHT07342.1 hypothetical protein TRFO_24526 [Tritrichomonas foetus]
METVYFFIKTLPMKSQKYYITELNDNLISNSNEFLSQLGAEKEDQVNNFNQKIFFDLEAFPLLLKINRTNVDYIAETLFLNLPFPIKHQFFIDSLQKAFYLRPSSISALLNTFDIFLNSTNQIAQNQPSFNFLIPHQQHLNEFKEIIEHLSNDDVNYFSQYSPSDIEKFTKFYSKYFTIDTNEKNNQKQNQQTITCNADSNNQEIPLIFVAALFDATKIFEFLLHQNGEIQTKSQFEHQIINASIIGRSHRILSILKKLNWNFEGHWKTAVKFQRLDIFIWLIPNLNQILSPSNLSSNSKSEFAQKLCEAAIIEENTELIFYLASIPDVKKKIFWRIDSNQKNPVISHILRF